MDIPAIPLTLIDAAREYDTSLRKLGLRAEGVAWGYDMEERGFLLFVIWSGVDRYGPLALNKLLFKAYNASALPQKIDPFVVTVLSPSHRLAEAMMEHATDSMMRYGRIPDPEKAAVHFQADWVVHMQRKRRSSLEIVKDWKRFTERVERLAA